MGIEGRYGGEILDLVAVQIQGSKVLQFLQRVNFCQLVAPDVQAVQVHQRLERGHACDLVAIGPEVFQL